MVQEKAARALPSFGRFLPWLFTVSGLIGFLAAFILTVEKIALIKDPAFEPSCNINPILSCGSVMVTPQAEVFGFPNSLLGIAGFAVVGAIGLALLAGARFKRWFWLLVQLGVTFAIGFVFWLQFQSIFNIGALCPYCMVVWAVTIPLFLYTTLHNIREGYFGLRGKALAAGNFLVRHHGDILALWYIAVIGLILQHFWYYWSTLL